MNQFDFDVVFGISGGLNLATLFLRIGIGGFLIFHGIRKSKNRFEGTINWFNSLGFPFNVGGGKLSAYSAAFIEIIGGLLLLVGFFTPYVAVIIVGQMLVATYVAIFKEKSAFISQTGQPGIYGYELDFLYVLAALALVFLGGGAFSFDGMFFP